MCSTFAAHADEVEAQQEMAAEPGSWTLEFPYRRSLGPVVGAFFTGLRDKKVVGSRTKDGRVLVPPLEYDPETGESVADGIVDVGQAGEVTGWAWVAQPLRKHPMQKPFAWALVKLDGADTSLLHALDASHDEVKRGMRVQIRWREERQGHITDIECFEPAATPQRSGGAATPQRSGGAATPQRSGGAEGVAT
jgi:hypothetical protein